MRLGEKMSIDLKAFKRGLHWGMGFKLVTKQSRKYVACPTCAKPLPFLVKFCPHCGKLLSQSLTKQILEILPKCPTCKTPIHLDWKYCPQDGTRLNQNLAQPT